MQDVPDSGSAGDGPPPRRRGHRGGRGRRGGRGGSEDRDSSPPPLPPEGEGYDAPPAEGSEGERKGRVPRHELLNPTPIPGRLRNDADEGLEHILSELDTNPPAPESPTDAPPPPRRERDDRRGGRGDRGERGGRGGRGERNDRGDRPPREPQEPRAASPAAFPPAREAPMTSTATPSSVQAPVDDFGAGIFEEPPVRRMAATPIEPARPAAPPPAAAVPKPAPADEDDGFGAGLL